MKALDFTEFGNASAEDWRNLIRKEVKDDGVFDRLFSRTINGISVVPVYAEGTAVNAFQSASTKLAVHFNDAYSDPGIINKLIVFARSFGADIISVETNNKSHYPQDGVTFLQNESRNFLMKSEGKTVIDVTRLYTENVHEELALVLQLIKALEELHIELRLPVTGNFFFQIAKFRALRLLLKDIFPQKKFTVNAVTSYYNKTLFDVNNNLLRASTEALAAIASGVDTLTVLPHDILLRDVSERSLALAMNIHHLLRSESNLKQVTDVAEGSYYIEHLTSEIVSKSNELYSSETVDNLLSRIGAFESSNAVIGVTKYPDKNEVVEPDLAYRERLLAYYGPHNTMADEMARLSQHSL